MDHEEMIAASQRQYDDLGSSYEDSSPEGEGMSEDHSGNEIRLSAADLDKFESIVEKHAEASAKAISDTIARSIPAPTSPWTVGLTVLGVTAAIIGSMFVLVGKDDEKRMTVLSAIKESVQQNATAVNGLTDKIHRLDVTVVQLNGSMKNLNGSVEGILVNFKGPPVGGRYWVAPPETPSD